jgi:hypothetical protein
MLWYPHALYQGMPSGIPQIAENPSGFTAAAGSGDTPVRATVGTGHGFSFAMVRNSSRVEL